MDNKKQHASKEAKKPLIKRILLGLLGLFVLAWILYVRVFSGDDFFEVKRGDITKDFLVSGEVVASEDINLAFESSGRVGDVFVKRNQEVKTGDLLAELDYGKLEAELKNTEADIELAKAELSQLLAGVSSEEIRLFEAQVESAKVDLESALKNFENVKIKVDNDRKQAYQQAVSFLDTVFLEAESAKEDLDSVYQSGNTFQPFFFIEDFSKKSDAEWQIIFTRDAFKKIKSDYEKAKDSPSEEMVDELIGNFKVNMEIIRVALSKTSEALDSAQVVSGTVSIDEYKESVRLARESINEMQAELLNKEHAIELQVVRNQTDVSAADSFVQLKRAALSEKEGELALKNAEPRDVEINLFNAQIKEAQTKKVLLQEEIENTKLFSPATGIIKSLNIKEGYLVKSQSSAISMSLLSGLKIKVEILEDDITKVALGDKVKILMDGESLKGEVIEVNTIDKIIKNNKSYFKLFIVFEGEVSDLKLKDSVNLSIATVVKKNVLLVPRDAVLERNETKEVILLENGSKKRVLVNIGESSENLVEIVSGLYDGDRVLLK